MQTKLVITNVKLLLILFFCIFALNTKYIKYLYALDIENGHNFNSNNLRNQNIQLVLIGNNGNCYLSQDSFYKNKDQNFVHEILVKPKLSDVWYIPEIINLFKRNTNFTTFVVLIGNYLSMYSPLTFLYPELVEDIWISLLNPSIIAFGPNEFYSFRFKHKLEKSSYKPLWTNILPITNNYVFDKVNEISELCLDGKGGIKIGFINLISPEYLSSYSVNQWGIACVEDPAITLEKHKSRFINYDLVFVISHLTNKDLKRIISNINSNVRIVNVCSSKFNYDNKFYNLENYDYEKNKVIFFSENDYIKVFQIQKYDEKRFNEKIFNIDLKKVSNKWFSENKKNDALYAKVSDSNCKIPAYKKLRHLLNDFESELNKPIYYVSKLMLKSNEYYKVSENFLAKIVLKSVNRDAVVLEIEDENFSDIRNINLAFLFDRYKNQRFVEICCQKNFMLDIFKRLNLTLSYKRVGFANISYKHISNFPIDIIIEGKRASEKSVYRIAISESLYNDEIMSINQEITVNPVDVTLWDCFIKSLYKEAMSEQNFIEIKN